MKRNSRVTRFLPMVMLTIFSLLHVALPAAAQTDNKSVAREHFEKGVAAFADRRFAEAAEEFDAAYRISPAFVVLYNIGQVNVALGRSVEAVEAFDKYLKQGASTVSSERKREVKAEIEKQLARIGMISVRTFPEGAALRVDGSLIGVTPLPRPLRVNAGRHNVEAILAGHAPQVREVDVAGRAEMALELTLEPVVASAPPPIAAAAGRPAIAPPPPPAAAPERERAAASEQRPLIEKIVIQTPPSSAPIYEKPELEREPRSLPSESASSSSGSSVNWQRIFGLVVTAGGLAGVTVGGLYAYRGANQANDANQRLVAAGSDSAAYNAALPDFDAGKRLNQRGWTIAGIGAAGLVGGIIVIATAPERRSSVALAPWMTAGSGGMTVNCAW